MFLSAVATSLAVLAVLNGVLDVPLHPKATQYAANILGGVVFGVGLTLAGACPGTVLAQVGAGYKDAWFTLAGALLGALAFGYVQPALEPVLFTEGPGKLTLDQLLGVPFWALGLVFAAVLVVAMIALERWRPWRHDLGSDFEGLSRAAEPRALPHGRVAAT